MMMIKKAIGNPKEMEKRKKTGQYRVRGSRKKGVGLSDYQKRIIKQRREELGLSQADLGKMIADMEGLDTPVAQASISNLERLDSDGDQVRSATQASKHLPTMEKILRLPVDFLKPGQLRRPILQPVQMPTQIEDEHAIDARVSPDDMSATTAGAYDTPPTMAADARDLPIFLSTYGQHGTIIVSTQAVEYIDRPARLNRVSGGHGIRVIAGYGMEPAFRPGVVVFLNPLMPPMPNTHVLLRKQEEGGEVLIRWLVGETADEWNVRQYSPDRTYALPKAEWPIGYQIIGTYEPIPQ